MRMVASGTRLVSGRRETALELYQIRYFLALSETLNFTRAAERCFVSQPALTKAIQKLEELLGGRLFDRTKNAVQLTDLGRAMLPNFQQIYATANQAREHARRLVREQREVIRLGVMCSIDIHQVLGRVSAFTEAHPAVDVQLSEGTLEDLIDRLDKHLVDVAVMSSPSDFPRRFSTTTLFEDAYVVAHARQHRFAGREAIALIELRDEPYCSRQNCEYSDHIDRVMQEMGFDVRVVQESQREDWIQSMVGAGLGVAFMPESLATHAGLAFVHTSDHMFVRRVMALKVSDQPQSMSVAALLTALQQAQA
jgi:LysR family hydrogen peroxide-inducible transcriptional activator